MNNLTINPSGDVRATSAKSHIRKVLKYVMLVHGLSQNELAQRLGVSKFKISRIINENSATELEFWENVCQEFQVNFDAVKTGLITSREQDTDELLNHLSPHFKHRFTLGPTAKLHTSLFKNIWGTEVFDGFCESNGISPLLFVNSNNPSSIEFNLRMLQYSLLRRKIGGPAGMAMFGKTGFEVEMEQGKFNYLYKNEQGVSRLKTLINNLSGRYERNHTYAVENISEKDQWIEISFFPNEHVNLSIYKNDPILQNSFEYFVHAFHSSFVNENTEVKILESFFKGSRKCTYRITKR